MAHFELTERDSEIIFALTHKVRMFSLAQIGRTWWKGNLSPVSDARKRLKILAQQGLVELFSILAHREIDIQDPLAVWEPGLDQVDFSKLSYQLKQRWPDPHLNTPVAIATKQAAQQFGGHGGRKPRRAEMTHDIHVSAVYLNFVASRPEDANCWVSEDEFNAHREKITGDKLPDAVLEKEDQTVAIEFGGEYEPKKLIAFHDWCSSKQMPYEIW